MPTDEERMAFKRQEREAAASIMGGDRYCPDPELHELVARAASQERPSIDVERLADATEIAAMALHRWKHPSFDLGEYRCRCRDDAEMAVRLLSPHNREAGE